MKLLEKFLQDCERLNEMDAGDVGGGVVSATSMSTVPSSLFKSIVTRPTSNKPKVIKYGSVRYRKRKDKIAEHKLINLFKVMENFGPGPKEDSFDSAEVLAKLKKLEDKESVDYRNTTSFGLVDSKGGIVRVTIPKDQAQSFEQDLHNFLGEYKESEPAPEIAEVLFKLRNHYNIIDVVWPEGVEDAEESDSEYDPKQPNAEADSQAMPGDQEQPVDDMNPLDTGEAGDQVGAGLDSASTNNVTDLLTQVIDMMKADADARKSEAQAREAEAKTHQAKAAREQAMARVKQEEQFLDMDAYNKSKKEKEKEAKRLAQLAKWKHDLSSEEETSRPAQDPQYDFLPGDENEEYANIGKASYKPSYENEEKRKSTGKQLRGKVLPSDIAKYIMGKIRN